MIVNTAVFEWGDDVLAADVSSLASALRACGDSIQGLIAMELGADQERRPGNGSFAVVATFVDDVALDRYLNGDEHRRIIAEFISRMAVRRLAVQFETAGPTGIMP